MTDYSFMKSGFNNVSDIETLSNDDKCKYMSAMTIYIQEAIKISEKFVKYTNRETITTDDIIKSLKVQALDNNDIWDTEDTKNRLFIEYNYFKKYFDGEELSDEDLSSEELSDEDEDKELSEQKEIKSDKNNNCCTKNNESIMTHEDYLLIYNVSDRFNNWNPTDKLNQIIKKGIENTETQFLDKK